MALIEKTLAQSRIEEEEEEMRRVMEMSMKEFSEMPADNGFSAGVNQALAKGFTLEQAFEAESMMGDNPEMIMCYLIQMYNGY